MSTNKPPPPNIKKECNHPGCSELIDFGTAYCEAHHKARVQDSKVNNSRYSNQDPETKAFYTSQRWRMLRRRFLRANPICNHCGTIAEMVDHIIQISKGGSKYNITNLQALCNSCHAKKSASESGRWSKRTP